MAESSPGMVWSCPPGFDRDFAERLLGRRRRQRLSAATARRINTLEKELPLLLAPRVIHTTLRPETGAGVISLAPGVEFTNPKMVEALAKAALVTCFIATIGPALDRRVEKLQAAGRLADASVLDALGSAAVEWLADEFQKKVEKEYQPRKMVAGPRFSPGYCDWPLADQPRLFSLLDHRQIAVELDQSCLMQPRKSISAIFGLYPIAAAPDDRDLIPCRRCPKHDCIARR